MLNYTRLEDDKRWSTINQMNEENSQIRNYNFRKQFHRIQFTYNIRILSRGQFLHTQFTYSSEG